MPNQNEVHYLKGEAQQVTDLSDLPQQAIVINSFDSKQIFIIKNLIDIAEENFKLTLIDDSSSETTKESYQNNFERMHTALQNGEINKIVLSRIKKVGTKKNGLQIFDALNKNYATTYNYIFSNPQIGTWLGASPELLLSATSNKIKTVSLAGTKLANANTEWTEKEITEQKIVTDFILETLKSRHFDDITAGETQTVNAGKIEHLKTEISATIKNQNSLYSLIKDLHPTPATCGFPKKIAFEKIQQFEKHSRKLYTGFIGVLKNDQQDFFVNLRCMQLFQHSALLYIGGGLTIDSDCEMEWQETERKANTLSDLL